MDDDSRALLQHRGKKAAVQAHGGEQIQLEFLLPDVIGQRQHAAGWRGRTADAINQNIETTEPVEGCPDDVIGSCARTDVRLDELFGIAARGDGPGRRKYSPAAAHQAIKDGFAYSPGAAGDENPSASEFIGVVRYVRCTHR